MNSKKPKPKKYQQPKPKFENKLITEDFQKDWWRHKIVTANKKEQK